MAQQEVDGYASSDMEMAPGTMINPSVRLVELLGTGGMGTVWLADHLGLEARVAVKFLSPELVAMDPSLRKRFKREASICARIRSIHVVQSFDHGTMHDGAPYIVMELLEGLTLTQWVEGKGPMSPRLVAMMVAQVVKVLHRAHVLGIVHRDIKPDNIFITDDSDYELFVKVLDFGIAKQSRVGAPSVTRTGAIVGTPEFMSPEQAVSSKDTDYRSDLFSLAVVTFYALTGQLPYDASGDDPLWLLMSEQRYRSARAFLPDLPETIDRWFSHALQAKPADRFQSARTMADAFATIVDPLQAQQIVDELSTSDGAPLRGRHREDEDSQPAMYDLIGPDSTDEYGSESTVLMDEADHQNAEDDEPPTVRRYPLKAVGAPLSRQVRGAVQAGVYNGGVSGAYNQVVSKTLIDESLASVPPLSPGTGHTTPMDIQDVWPTAVVAPKSRVPAMLAVVGALAVLTVMVVMAWLHLA